MEGRILFVIIGVIVMIVRSLGRANKVKSNAPGRASAPNAPARPASAPQPPIPAVPAPTGRDDAGMREFWKQASALIGMDDERDEDRDDDEGHGMVRPDMTEGDSRECEHGSVGGSMAYDPDSHEGGGAVAEKAARLGGFVATQAREDSLYRPAMSPRQMRQAIVMAEILRRPQERMAGNARRWR